MSDYLGDDRTHRTRWAGVYTYTWERLAMRSGYTGSVNFLPSEYKSARRISVVVGLYTHALDVCFALHIHASTKTQGPYSNSGLKTGTCQIARSSFEIARFAEIELWPGFEIAEAVP